MSLSPIALEALRAAQSAFSVSEADVFEDALARGLEAADREGRIVGAFQAQELARLEKLVAELELQVAALSAQQQVLQSRPADGITRAIAPTQALQAADDPIRPCGCPKRFNRHAEGCPTLPEGEFYGFLHHENRVGHDLPPMGGA